MDVLGGLLDGVRARGAFVLRLSLDPPWSMRIQDEAPLTLICMTHGEAVLVSDAGVTLVVRPGDVAVAKGVGASAATGKGVGATGKGSEHYLFADDAGTEPQVVIHPGNRCTTLRGEDLRFAMSVGVRTWGNAAAGAHQAVICAYQDRSEVSARLLDALVEMAAVVEGLLSFDFRGEGDLGEAVEVGRPPPDRRAARPFPRPRHGRRPR